MREYHRNPEATKRVIRDGWFYTGDLGKFDQDGFLYIIGRTKDMINRGGEKIYALEVETQKVIRNWPVYPIGVVSELLNVHPETIRVSESSTLGFPKEKILSVFRY